MKHEVSLICAYLWHFLNIYIDSRDVETANLTHILDSTSG